MAGKWLYAVSARLRKEPQAAEAAKARMFWAGKQAGKYLLRTAKFCKK